MIVVVSEVGLEGREAIGSRGSRCSDPVADDDIQYIDSNFDLIVHQLYYLIYVTEIFITHV